MMRIRPAIHAAVLAGLGLALAARAVSPPDTGQRIIADREPQNWLSHGRTYAEARHSPLDQIGIANVGRLGLAWSHDLDTDHGQEGTPLVVDGVMYTTSAWSKVQAFNAATGKLLWQYDPQVPGPTAVKACCDVVNRGAAYWNGKVYVGTLDGRLVALDAKSGTPIWSVVTVDQSKNYTITGAPRVVKGRVLIGQGGAEYAVRGYISAYDAETGKLDWRFYTVPGDPARPDHAASDTILAAKAAPTWSADTWARTQGGGGGTVWDSMAYDPDLDLLYVGVGNGGLQPLALRSPKKEGNNDNLFLGSVVALRPETGEYVWHYQETPADQWDYTSTQQMILADLPIDGKPRKVLLHAPKNGFFYVLDRATGQLLSANAYSTQTWAKGIDLKTGRPIPNPESDYSTSGKAWAGIPGPAGAHNWQSMAYDPATGLVYIPMREAGMVYKMDQDFHFLAAGVNTGLDTTTLALPDDPKALAAIRAGMKGFLIAWDPVAKRERWRVPMAGDWNGGILSTAGGLVFEGDEDGRFSAYDAKDGERLWSFDGQSAISAAPISYAVNGRQYVTVLAGWGTSAGTATGPLTWSKDGPRVNRSRVLTFALDGRATLPPPAPRPVRPFVLPPQTADAATIEQGRIAYHRTCFACHGVNAISAGVFPDLRRSSAIASAPAWKAIVADGALKARGMVGFGTSYTMAQLEAIRAYVAARAHRAATAERP